MSAPLDPGTITVAAPSTAGLVSPERVGEVGSRLARSADVLDDFYAGLAEEQQSLRRQGQYGDAANAYNSSMTELAKSLEGDQDPGTWTQRFEAAEAEARQAASALIDDVADREDFDQKSDEIFQRKRLAVYQEARRAQVDKIKANLAKHAETVRAENDGALFDQDAFDQTLRHARAFARRSGLLSDEEVDTFIDGIKQQNSVDRINRLVDEAPREALAIAKDADLWADLGMDPEQRRTAEKNAQRGIDAELAEFRERSYSDLRVKEAEAITPAEISEVENLVDQLAEGILPQFGEPAISPSQAADIRVRLINKRATAEANREDLTQYLKDQKDGIASSQSVVDAVYENYVFPVHEKADTKIRYQAMAHWVMTDGKGMVPKKVEDQLVGAFRIGDADPELTVAAAMALTSIADSNMLSVDATFEDADISLARRIVNSRALVGDGHAASIVAQAQKEQQVFLDPAHRGQVESNYRKALSEASLTNEEALQAEIDLGVLDNPLWRGGDKKARIGSRLQTHINQRIKGLFATGSTLEEARTQAFREGKLRWGPTDVGALVQTIELPPEKAYPLFAGDSEAIEEQMRFEVQTAIEFDDIDPASFFGLPDGMDMDDILDLVVISSDVATAGEVDPQSGAPRPGYALWILTPGGLNPLALNDGSQVRFYPDYDLSPAKQRAVNEARDKKETDDRRNQSSQRRIARLRQKLDAKSKLKSQFTSSLDDKEHERLLIEIISDIGPGWFTAVVAEPAAAAAHEFFSVPGQFAEAGGAEAFEFHKQNLMWFVDRIIEMDVGGVVGDFDEAISRTRAQTSGEDESAAIMAEFESREAQRNEFRAAKSQARRDQERLNRDNAKASEQRRAEAEAEAAKIDDETAAFHRGAGATDFARRSIDARWLAENDFQPQSTRARVARID